MWHKCHVPSFFFFLKCPEECCQTMRFKLDYSRSRPMTINTWKVIPGGTSREGQKWEKGENIGCINQMITVRSPWINLTKKLRMMLLSNPQSYLPPPPRSENTKLFPSKSFCHSLRAVSSDITDLIALMAYLCGSRIFVQWEKSLGRELHLFGIKCLWRVRSQEVMAQGSGIEHQLYLKVRYCYSSDT